MATHKEEGKVFEAKGTSVDPDEAAKEMEGITFDAHFVTGKIIEFGKILTGVPLYWYQYLTVYRIIYSVISLEGATITMLFSRQSGKSESLAFAINALTVILPALAKIFPDLDQYRDGIKIGLFAPQSDQVVTTYSRAMNRIQSENAEKVMDDPDLEVGLESHARYVLSNGSYMVGQTASKQSKIESKTYDLVFIEEAQDMDSFIVQKSIEPMCAATNGTIIKCGTTGQTKNDFWYEIQHNVNISRKVKDERLRFHFQFDYLDIIKDKRKQFEIDGKLFHLNYEKTIQKEIAKGKKTTQVFKLAYALEWDLDSGMLMSDREWAKLINKKLGFQISDDDFSVAGLDIAKSPASTVLTIGKVLDDDADERGGTTKQVTQWIELEGMDYESQHHAIIDYLIEFNVKILYFDYTGVGKAVGDRLMYACGDYIQIVPYTFSSQSKSDMYFNLIGDMQTKRLIVPGNKVVQNTKEFQRFEEQMKNAQKYYNGAYLVVEKTDGHFDDYVDSLALMCLAGNVEPEPEVEEDDFNPFASNIMDNRRMINNNSW